MSRIAFVSCVRIPYKDDFDHDPPCKLVASEFEQPVWSHLLAKYLEQPFDAMLFLGDQVYTDYGWLHAFGGKRPLNWDADRFHRLLYAMYSAQYTRIPAFRQLMQRLHDDHVQIGMIWDDHDFGYNNASGLEPKFANKLASTKVLFQQFLEVVQTMPPSYPLIPAIPTATQPTQGIERITNPITLRDGVEVVLLDGRSHRDIQVGNGAELLGATQWGQLQTRMTNLPQGKLMIVCLGSTYSVAGALADQSWKNKGQPYAYFDQFTQLASEKHVLFLTGDIHRNDLIAHPGVEGTGFTEVISSGAHLPKPRWWEDPSSPENQYRFGLLDIDTTQIYVKLYANNQVEISKTISRDTGLPIP